MALFDECTRDEIRRLRWRSLAVVLIAQGEKGGRTGRGSEGIRRSRKCVKSSPVLEKYTYSPPDLKASHSEVYF